MTQSKHNLNHWLDHNPPGLRLSAFCQSGPSLFISLQQRGGLSVQLVKKQFCKKGARRAGDAKCTGRQANRSQRRCRPAAAAMATTREVLLKLLLLVVVFSTSYTQAALATHKLH
jgi:hypothetical protein